MVSDSKVSTLSVRTNHKADQVTEGAKPAFGGSGFNAGQSRPAYQDRNANQESQGSGKRLYFGNLPAIDSSSDVEQAIHSLIDPIGVEIATISPLKAPHESKAAEPGDHHYCFVDLARADDVEAVIQALDGKSAPWSQDGSSTLRVNKAREQANRRFGDRPQGTGYQGGYQGRRTEGDQSQGAGYQGGYQGRRTEGQRDWRTAAAREENPQ